MNAERSSQHSDRRAKFLALTRDLRGELHRYCARLMGSVIDGEDVVQDTFTRAFVALDELEEDAPMSRRRSFEHPRPTLPHNPDHESSGRRPSFPL